MLQDYIPSYESSSSICSSGSGRAVWESREGAKLLSNGDDCERGFRCFSIYDIKRKVVAGIHRACDREGQWRYLILGEACHHLGLLEDALILLQTSRRLSSAASRRLSSSHSDDFFSPKSPNPKSNGPNPNSSSLLPHIKLLLRRRSSASSALLAGHPLESARLFSKILDARRPTPRPFAASCLIGRAASLRSAGRAADAIADCNRALALDPSSVPALAARADLLESIRCLADCLRDLDHLKLLYDALLRDRKLPGPIWRRAVSADYLRGCRDVPSRIRLLTARINGIRERFFGGEGNSVVDYYKLIGVRRNCSRSELERANLILLLRHRPDKAGAFAEKVDFGDGELDVDEVRDQARMSAMILYRMLQKGYGFIMARVVEEEEEAEAKKRAAAQMVAPAMYQGGFCRDTALSRAIKVNYEGLSC